MTEDAAYPRFSKEEFARRHVAAREIMEASSLHAMLLFGNRAASNEIQYLTNHIVAFEGLLLFSAEGEPVLWVNYANHVADARRISIVDDVRWGEDDIADTAAAELRRRGLGVGRIGIGGPLVHSRWMRLQDLCPQLELVDRVLGPGPALFRGGRRSDCRVLADARGGDERFRQDHRHPARWSHVGPAS